MFSVSWLVDFQWGQCGSIFSFLCHGWQTFRGVRVAQSLVFCVMVGRLLVWFVWLNLQFSVTWLVDFQWASCGSIFRFLCHGRYGVRVALLLVGFVWLNLQFSVSWLVDFQWGSCGSIFRFLCHGWQTFSGVRVAQSLVFCVMVGRLLVGFVWLNLQFSVSWLVDFQWGSCGSIFSFLCHGWQWGSYFLVCPGWQTFSGLRVAQSLVFCDILLVGFVWLNLQFSVSWLVDFQWASCGSIFRFLCHGRYTFSGVRVAQSFVFCVMVSRLLVGFVWLNLYVFCVMVGRLLVGSVWLNLQFSVSWQVDFQWGSCGSIFSFLCHGRQTFSGVRVAQSLAFCVMVGKFLVGFVWLNLQFFVSWQVDFQWASCVSIFCFLCHGWQTFSGFVWLKLQFSVSWLVYFQWGSCGSIFSFLCHGWQTFSGFVWLNLLFSVSWSVDFYWGSCGLIFSFLCHGWQTFRGVRVAQSLVFCVIVGRLLMGFVWLNLYVFCVMVGRLLVGSVWLNLQFSVSWLVDFQGGSCGSIFSFLCHGWQTFSGVRVAQSLVFCDLVGRLLLVFVWLNLQFSVSWQVDFQWGSCGSIFSFLCHGWQTFSGVRVAQSLDFCVMVGRLLVGFVWLNLQFSVSWLVDFQWASRGSIFRFLCHGWQTFSGVRVAQSLVFCVMVGRLLVGFVWLNFQFSVSWLVNFQWGSCGSIFSFLCHGRQIFSGLRMSQSFVFCVMVGRLLVGSCGSNFSFLCQGWQTFRGVRVAQSLVFCVMVGRVLVGSCGSIFSFLCHGWQTFSGVRVAQSLVFCVMVGRLLGGFVWLNLQFSVSWQVDFQGGSCGSIFSFLCHGWQTFSGVRVAQSLVFCVMVGRLLVGFVWLNLQFSVSWLVDFQWGSCGSIFMFSVSWLVDFQWGQCGSIFIFLCHGWQTFSGVRVAQSLIFCVMVGRLLVGSVWLNLQFSVTWLVDFQWASCGSIFCFCVMVGILLVGFVWLNLLLFVSWLVDF